jgi:hypothetical protein
MSFEYKELSVFPLFLQMVVLLLVLLLTCSRASVCTDQCDNTSPNGAVKYRFCGTNLETHVSSREAVIFRDCYGEDNMNFLLLFCVTNKSTKAYCGVSVLYVGACGCPNDCGGSNGQCVNATNCVCNQGWKGGAGVCFCFVFCFQLCFFRGGLSQCRCGQRLFWSRFVCCVLEVQFVFLNFCLYQIF